MELFENLFAELGRMRMPVIGYGKRIGVSESSIRNKLKGRTEFTCAEMLATSKLVDKSLDHLFAEHSTPTGENPNA
jgi:hypothetical protein